MNPADPVLSEQLAYYCARAEEYDEWWQRTGRYDRGEAHRTEWNREIAVARDALISFAPQGEVLELAGGTGIWSRELLACSGGIRLTVLDGSAEMLRLNAARTAGHAVRHLQADLFTWEPDRKWDTVFFSFWLSHVPEARFEGFWEMIRRALAPGGRVFFIDSLREPASTAQDHQLPPPESETLQRRLNDGRTFRICKAFHEPGALAARLHALGWHGEVRSTGRFFYTGAMQPDNP